jgi:hypothetical protein
MPRGIESPERCRSRGLTGWMPEQLSENMRHDGRIHGEVVDSLGEDVKETMLVAWRVALGASQYFGRRQAWSKLPQLSTHKLNRPFLKPHTLRPANFFYFQQVISRFIEYFAKSMDRLYLELLRPPFIF